MIAHALSGELKLDIAQTKRRNHATHLAAGAAHEGYDLIVCFGGDGTLNEVINGLARTDVPLVPIPGGGTNVFARTMGLPKDPIEATSIVLEKLHAGAPPRRINLGKMNGRYFAFCAGAALDAQVVRSVERASRTRKRFGEWSFVTHAVATALRQQGRRGPLRVFAGDEMIGRVHAAVVCNSSPYTFLGDKKFDVCPRAKLEEGLDATIVTTLAIPTILRVVTAAFGSGDYSKIRKVRTFHDLSELRAEADAPVPVQVDGDYAGTAARVEFESVPRALAVIA